MSVPSRRARRAAGEAEKLAEENELMERRLRELKMSMRKDRENREAKGGYTWRSGKADKRNHGFANDVLKQNAQRRAKGGRMKYLQHEPEPVVTASRRIQPHPPSPARRRTQPPAKLSQGTFDEAGGHASFIEALEDWRRGGGGPQQFMTPPDESNISSSSGGGVGHGVGTSTSVSATASLPTGYPPLPPEGGGALLRGPAFNEDAAAASFQDALREWRGGGGGGGSGGDGNGAATASASSGVEVQAGGSDDAEARREAQLRALEAQIVNGGSSGGQVQGGRPRQLSYMEKLKANRKNQQQSPAPTGSGDGGSSSGGRTDLEPLLTPDEEAARVAMETELTGGQLRSYAPAKASGPSAESLSSYLGEGIGQLKIGEAGVDTLGMAETMASFVEEPEAGTPLLPTTGAAAALLVTQPRPNASFRGSSITTSTNTSPSKKFLPGSTAPPLPGHETLAAQSDESLVERAARRSSTGRDFTPLPTNGSRPTLLLE